MSKNVRCSGASFMCDRRALLMMALVGACDRRAEATRDATPSAIVASAVGASAGDELPRWSGGAIAARGATEGVSARLRFTAHDITVIDDGETHAVVDAAAATGVFDALLRGYRRREGLRRDPGSGALVHGGSGALAVRVEAPASTPLARLAAIVREESYSGWAGSLRLAVRVGATVAEVPFAWCRRSPITLPASASFQDLADALARAREQGPCVTSP